MGLGKANNSKGNRGENPYSWWGRDDVRRGSASNRKDTNAGLKTLKKGGGTKRIVSPSPYPRVLGKKGTYNHYFFRGAGVLRERKGKGGKESFLSMKEEKMAV